LFSGVALVASLAFAGTAGADAGDQQYLNLVNAAGLGCGQGPFDCPNGDASMIAIGRSICKQLGRGNSTLSIEQLIMRQKPAMQPDAVVSLVTAAKTAYCPD
jgi:uncharacterized protein DUF732